MPLALIWSLINNAWFTGLSRRNWSLETSFVRSLCVVLFMQPLLLLADFSLLSFFDIALLFTLWFIWAISVISHLKSFHYLPIWVAQSIISLNNIIILLLGYLVYSEVLSVFGYIWAVVIFVSGIWMSLIKSRNEHLSDNFMAWVGLALLRATLRSFWMFGFAYYSREADIFAVAYLAETTVLVGFMPFILHRVYRWTPFLKNYSFEDKKKTFLLSIPVAINVFCMFYATVLGSVWYVVLLLSTVNVFAAVVWHYLYYEMLTNFQWFLVFSTVAWIFILNLDKIL